jgi:hypothetical protein
LTSTHDRHILRVLASQVAELAGLPVMSERRRLWKQHNRLQPTRPLILVFPEGSWEELLTQADLQCEGEPERQMEWELRHRIYYHDHFQDDTVIEKEWIVHKQIHSSGWGLEVQRVPSPEARGAWKFQPVIAEMADLEQLRYPAITYDEKTTLANLEQAHDLFGDLLDVRLKGVDHLSYHLMSQYSDWRGLEETMLDMYQQPEMLHAAMQFLEEGHHRILQQYQDLNLLSLNNDSTYHSSGGNGYTDELPAPGFDSQHVRPCDMWASAESQELAQVGPRQHAEFALAYEKRLLEPFGLTGYGCCEDLTRKLTDVLTIPHIRRISISPFAQVEASAEQLGNGYIFSWKPDPWHLVGDFDENAIRAYLRQALAATRRHGCIFEMILKDTHTCDHHPERFDRWTCIARQEVEHLD